MIHLSPFAVGMLSFSALFILTFLKCPIALAAFLSGVAGIWYILGYSGVKYVLSIGPVVALDHYSYSLLPIFILMASFANHGKLAAGIFDASYGLIGHRKGGLGMASILACGGFGAICGSSLVTVTTISKIAIPQMLRYRYQKHFASGAVAAGSTLGILIPPSIPMIFYAIITENSVGKLFAAGIIPGIVTILLYIATIAIWTKLKPDIAPAADTKKPFKERLRLLKGATGIGIVFVVVLGGIMSGLFTPTEGAAVGATSTFIVCLLKKTMTIKILGKCLLETLILSCSIFILLMGLYYFKYLMALSQAPQYLAHLLTTTQLSPFNTMLLIILALVLLGCVLETIAILFIIVPLIYPTVIGFGYDPIWFGIIIIMIIEIGQITPPIGINLFMIARTNPEIKILDAIKGVIPFTIADIIRIIFFLIFPGLVIWLPNLLFK